MIRTLTLAAALACAAAPALADETAVAIPYGDWIVGLSGTFTAALVPVAVAAILWALRTYVPVVGALVSQSLVERLVRNASDYALNAVSGAAKGAVLDVPTGSAVIAKAAQRAIDQAPGWLLRQAGGPAGVAEKVFRVLHLDAAATAANTLAPALRAVRGGAR